MVLSMTMTLGCLRTSAKRGNMTEKTEQNFWIGPADVRIPMDVNEVPGLPPGSIMYQDGHLDTTNTRWLGCTEPDTEEQYRECWAKCVDGVWYWKYKKVNGMLVERD